MTIIAYRHGVLAADRLHTNRSARMASSTKVHKHDGWLFGCSGEEGWDDDVRQLIGDLDLGSFKVLPWPTFPPGWACLLVAPDGRFSEISATAKWEPLRAPFWAIGCGAPFALGALAHGATARQAVIVAQELDVHCGGGVDETRLETVPAVALA